MTNQQYRKIKLVKRSRQVMEGAGVRLKRAFGSPNDAFFFDPFLLLDDFHSDKPKDYLKGFPWHPHRGIETITYMLHGEVEHQDSLGNKGMICQDEVQWMTAGSGIIHSEMPKQQEGILWGFQLWANLPAVDKMMKPRYRDISSDQICLVRREDGTKIRVIAGEVDGFKGPVTDVIIDPQYLDVQLPAHSEFIQKVPRSHTVFAYVIEGEARFDQFHNDLLGIEQIVLYEKNTVGRVKIQTDSHPVRFLLISGKPLNEPIAWNGPIVMNTREELNTAFHEYNNGTFLKYKN
ncbi:pirin family protein [Promethearchaeum syntrophicum]|uniref:Pirin family protein n=1 Tax=Promethearchaeum syntrophicum TaxID=2594042 RepID=A0A5B9DC60_9ARCH|nr:pirin family protein [Candidatus Prometheoarchaeum syntrophicum]QEE16585.1 Pirin [Candidatus Prometheoarchaeum syntrophicum]